MSAGPMVELDGRSRTPDFFLPYVSFIILGTILVPSAALGLLIKDGNADLGFSTVGVYLLCLIVQIASESIALRTGECPLLVVIYFHVWTAFARLKPGSLSLSLTE